MSSDSGARNPQNVNHVVELLLGGSDLPPKPKPKAKQKRTDRVHLRVIAEPVDWMPKAGLPAGGRDECRTGERPCPYVRCKWHLWLVLSEDRPGRPWRPDRPRVQGRWLQSEERGGQRATTLIPAWLEYPTPACCALDIGEAVAGGASIKLIADAMHVSIDSVFRIIRMGKQKLFAMKSMRELADA